MGYGLLGSVFRVLDPILDTADPMHNKVQEWTTGSKETEKQSPYFETIAPMVIDAFFPGIGSAIGAVDGASTGNWTKAGLSALGSYAQLGNVGSAAAGAGEGLSASGGLGSVSSGGIGTTGAMEATGSLGTGISAGSSSGVGALNSGADSFGSLAANGNSVGSGTLGGYAAHATNGYNSFNGGAGGSQSVANSATAGQPGADWKYYDNGTAISPDGSYYHQGEMITGAGGQPKGLLDYAGEYAGKANRAVDGKTVRDTAKVYGSYEKELGAAEQRKAQREAQMNGQMRQQMASFGGMDSGGQARPAQSIASLSPYAQFNGGFNPKRYGANVRGGLL
jgi:hypothetical protein